MPSPKENETKPWHCCRLGMRSLEWFRVSSCAGRAEGGSLVVFTQKIAQIAAHIEETNGLWEALTKGHFGSNFYGGKKMSLDLNFGDIWELKSRDE